MATLLATLSSDEEDDASPQKNDAGAKTTNSKKAVAGKPKKEHKQKKVEEETSDDASSSSSSDDEGEEFHQSFEFGGLLGEDGPDFNGIGGDMGSLSTSNGGGGNAWSYKSALRLLQKNDTSGMKRPEPTAVANLVAAVRSSMKKREGEEKEESVSDDNDDEASASASASGSGDEDGGDSGDSSSESSDSDDSDSDSSEDDEEDDAAMNMEGDMLKERTREDKVKKGSKKKKKAVEKEEESSDESDGDEDDDDSASDDDEEDEDEDAREEAARAAAYFDTVQEATSAGAVTTFAQLNLSRPLLRGVASMGFVTPTPIQGSVIPVALSGRDVCASAVTGSGKTAAFLLPIMERILQRGGGRVAMASSSSSRGGRKGNAAASAAATRALIMTPTRELAAQCVSMMTAIGKFTSLRVALVVGGAKNVAAQAAELRTRPDVVVATPGRILDHITNSPGVDLDDLEFLVLDESDRLLDLGFQDETHEIIKSCPTERQTLLFSATMGTKVDELIKLSLNRPVRVRVSDRKGRGGDASGDGSGVEVADRLEQEFVRVRTGNEGINREAMLLSLLTRTFKERVIVFFDTKAAAHRLMIICGLCGIKCAELHGNLTQPQRLEALEAFREGEVDVLLATDLAARGLDITGVQAVVNFEMPSQVDTYVHRIGRTARAGRGGKSCTLIGEGRRYLMKEVIKDAEDKRRKAESKKNRAADKRNAAGIIRSRTIPPAVVSHYVAKIASLEPHVEEVLAAEAVARMDRIAEMEAMRVENIIAHTSEIKARPQREWFASTKQKMSAKEAAAEKQRMIAEKVGTGMHRMTRKKRRAREAKEEALQMQEEMREEQVEMGRRPGQVVTEESMKGSARAAKRQEARKEKEHSRKSLYDEDQERESKRKQREARDGKKRKGAFATDAMGDGSLFAEEKIAFGAKKNKVGENEAATAASRYQFSEFDPNMKKKKGGKKGHTSFKSKKKFKRR